MTENQHTSKDSDSRENDTSISVSEKKKYTPVTSKEVVKKTSGLISGSTIIFLSNILIAVSGFILGGILMHKMPNYMYGMARTLQRAISITTIISLKGVGNSLVVHLSSKKTDRKLGNHYIYGSLIFSLLSGIIFALIAFFTLEYVIQPRIDIIGGISSWKLLLGLFLVFPLAFSVSALSNSLLGVKKIKETAIAISIQCVGNLLFTTLFVYLGVETPSVIFGLAIGSFLSVLYSTIILRKYMLAPFKEQGFFRGMINSLKKMRIVFSYSSPLTLATICSQLIEGVTIIIVLSYFNWGHTAFIQLAYFNYIMMLIVAFRMPQEAIGKMLLPHLKETSPKESKEQLQNAIRLLMMVTVPINLFAGLFAKELLELLVLIIQSKALWLENGAATITPLMQLLTIGGHLAAAYYLLMNSCIPLNRADITAKIEFAGLIAMIALINFLIPAHGILSVGYAYIISYGFMLLYALISMSLNGLLLPISVVDLLGVTVVVGVPVYLIFLFDISIIWRVLIAVGALGITYVGIIRIRKEDLLQFTSLVGKLFKKKNKAQQDQQQVATIQGSD